MFPGYNQFMITANLKKIHQALALAAVKAGRNANAITLVAVSKTKPVADIQAALESGQRLFGENRVQEAALKFPSLRETYPDLRLHLIGPLQTNKVDEAVKLFDVIETLDRPKLAEALAKAKQKHGRCPALYVEINIGGEPQKAGVSIADAPAFIKYCRDDLGLPVTGVMCIPPHLVDPSPYFRQLKNLADTEKLPNISMGMSGDFEIAIACGATEARVGSAIFGERDTKAKS
jgi:PLP dependent protein